MEICVKYCGGCNPRYNRSKIIKKIKKKFHNINVITNLNENEICDFVIVVSGCSSSCVNHKHLNGKFGKKVIKTLKDYWDLESELERVIEKGDVK